MPKRTKQPPTPPQPTGYYAEQNIVWEQPNADMQFYVATNLDGKDEAYVAKSHYPGGEKRWFWRATDGILIEREFLSPGLVETQFTAQVKAIQWLNKRRALIADAKEPIPEINAAKVQEIFSQAAAPSDVAEHIALGYTATQSHVDPNGVTVVTEMNITEVSAVAADEKPFADYFPRHMDFRGYSFPVA